MLNRYGHGQSYTQTLELETAMCNAVTSAESLLPPNISTDINVVLHIHVCLHEWGNTIGFMNDTFNIAIQKISDRSRAVSVNKLKETKNYNTTSTRNYTLLLKDKSWAKPEDCWVLWTRIWLCAEYLEVRLNDKQFLCGRVGYHKQLIIERVESQCKCYSPVYPQHNAASHECAIATFDLAVARKAYF